MVTTMATINVFEPPRFMMEQEVFPESSIRYSHDDRPIPDIPLDQSEILYDGLTPRSYELMRSMAGLNRNSLHGLNYFSDLRQPVPMYVNVRSIGSCILQHLNPDTVIRGDYSIGEMYLSETTEQSSYQFSNWLRCQDPSYSRRNPSINGLCFHAWESARKWFSIPDRFVKKEITIGPGTEGNVTVMSKGHVIYRGSYYDLVDSPHVLCTVMKKAGINAESTIAETIEGIAPPGYVGFNEWDRTSVAQNLT